MWKLCVLVLYALAPDHVLAKCRPGDKDCADGAARTSTGSTLSRRLDAITYEEGSVIDMDYNRNWFRSEEIARAACSKDDGAKGIGSETATATALATVFSSF